MDSNRPNIDGADPPHGIPGDVIIPFKVCSTTSESHITLCTNKLTTTSLISSPSTTSTTSVTPWCAEVPLGSSCGSPEAGKIPVMLQGGALEEHLLLLHFCLESSAEGGAAEGVAKVIEAAQAALKSAGRRERDVYVSFLGSQESGLVPRFVSVLESSAEDYATVGAICGFFHDCLAPLCDSSLRMQLIKTLVQNNFAEVLLRIFKSFPPTVLSKGDSNLLQGFQVIAKLASKDAKLAVKCRLVGSVKFTHVLIQNHSKNNQLLLPLLILLKFIAKNPTNQVVLGKDGCVTTLVSLLNVVPKSHWAKIKLILENLALLTKTKSNVIRLVRESGLSKVLSLLETWEKMDKRYQTKILRALLCVLSHLCDSKHGRKAVLSLKGDDIIHRFIVSCPSEPQFDSLLGIALNVFLKCSSKGELPVMSLKGAITFHLPSGNTSSQPDSDTRETTPDPDQDSSDDDDFGEDDEEGFESKGIDFITTYNVQTARLEDLLKVGKFFPEFQDPVAEPSDSDKRINPRKDSVKGVSSPGESAGSGCSPEQYLQLSSGTKSLINFVKVAYPDLVGAEGPDVLEPLYQKNSKVIREKALRTMDRVLNANHYHEKVVFDLDYLLESEHTRQLITPTSPSLRNLSNWDEKRVGKKDIAVNHLNFESRFESGNLRRAIQIAPYEYELVLNSDVNSWHHHQWFYFEVSNMEASIPYIINIINNEKPNSEFNFGMKPVIFSVKEAMLGRGAWVRTGYDICYHKNHFVRFPKDSEKNSKFRRGSGKCYYTASMTIKFPHANDVVYLAYHYPYTFTKLQTFLATFESDDAIPSNTFYRNQTLCHSLNGNPLPLLTITSRGKKAKEKEVIILTARVHPGESNSSWVMQGTINFLLGRSEEASALRDNFIFKIVPMLNPEGVIHGNQRCGLTDEDLNRRWRAPSHTQHPTIYFTKTLIEHLTAVIGKRPLIFCDFHGHSRQKNVFMYGCSRQKSWWIPDREVQEDREFMTLPRLAQLHMSTFSLHDCRFNVERARESTARVTVWRQFQVGLSFTMEASTCGCDCGPYKNHHLSPKLLKESGEGFGVALFHFGCANHSSHKALINNRLAWMGSVTPNAPSEPSPCPEDLFEDVDSEDDLDFELYGMVCQDQEVKSF